MKLIMHGTAPQRVLVGQDRNDFFKSCQENRKGDEQRFKDLLNDPDHVITKYEDTDEGIEALAKTAVMEKKLQIQALEQKALRSMIAVALNPSNTAEKNFLKKYSDQIEAIAADIRTS